MNKKKAREEAMSGVISIGQLREMISAARGRGGMSSVNNGIPLDRALDIYDRALEGRPGEEIPKVLMRDPYGRDDSMKPTGDVLLIINILRDAG